MISQKGNARVFISKQKEGKESELVERQREIASVRGGVLQQEEDSIGNKADP